MSESVLRGEKSLKIKESYYLWCRIGVGGSFRSVDQNGHRMIVYNRAYIVDITLSLRQSGLAGCLKLPEGALIVTELGVEHTAGIDGVG